MRPTGLGHGAYKDNIDYNIFSGEWLIGRIYERNGFPDEVRFFWSLHGVVLTQPPSIHTDGTTANLEEVKAAVSEELGCLEGVGEAGRGALTSLSPLAVLPNSSRFFLNLLSGVTPFRRDRYRCRSSICGRHDGLGNDFIGGRFGDASAQSKEAKRGCVLRLKS